MPISNRVRKATRWDLKPQGFEAVSAAEAKASGEHHLFS